MSEQDKKMFSKIKQKKKIIFLKKKFIFSKILKNKNTKDNKWKQQK